MDPRLWRPRSDGPTSVPGGSGHATIWVLIAIAIGGAVPTATWAQGPELRVIDGPGVTAPLLSDRARTELLEEHLAAHPDDYGLRWRTAQQYAQIGLTEPDPEAQKQLWDRARRHATAAKELRPDGLESRYWLAVAAALLADVSGGRTKVRLGDEAYRESAWVLEVDSLHAGAHYLQGRIHASVMRLSSLMRFLARAFVGGDALRGASWERAVYHLRRATELQPELAMHHFELAMAYESLGLRDQMIGALHATVHASQSTPFQGEFKRRARKRLFEEGQG